MRRVEDMRSGNNDLEKPLDGCVYIYWWEEVKLNCALTRGRVWKVLEFGQVLHHYSISINFFALN